MTQNLLAMYQKRSKYSEEKEATSKIYKAEKKISTCRTRKKEEKMRTKKEGGKRCSSG